jgi:hypothetical protein
MGRKDWRLFLRDVSHPSHCHQHHRENAPQLAAVKPLLVLMTFVIATLYAAILDTYVDSYFRRLRKRLR